MAEGDIQFGVYLVERMKDNKATPILEGSNLPSGERDSGLGFPLRANDLSTIYNYPSSQLPQMYSVFNSFRRHVDRRGGYRGVHGSFFAAGDDRNYVSFSLRVPEENWSDLLLGSVMGVRGMLHADLFHKKKTLFEPQEAMSSFVDIEKPNDKVIRHLDSSGYAYSNFLAGWGSALGALLPRVSGINRRDLFDLENSGVGNSSFLRLAMPPGKDIFEEKNKRYSQVVGEALTGLSQRYDFDINERIRREIDRASPVFEHIQDLFSQARYEADLATPIPDTKSRMYSVVGGSTQAVDLSSSSEVRERMDELPEELPEPTLFKNRIVRWLATNVVGKLLSRKDIKVPGIFTNKASYGAVKTAYQMSEAMKAIEKDEDYDFSMLDVTVEGQLDMADRTLPDWAREELSKYQISLGFHGLSTDALVVMVNMAQTFRSAVEEYGWDKKKLSHLVDEIHPPNARIVALSQYWSLLKSHLKNGELDKADKIKENILGVIEGGDRDLRDYENLFLDDVYYKKDEITINDIKTAHKVIEANDSGKQLLSEMEAVEEGFYLIGSDWAKGQYPDDKVYFPVLPPSYEVRDVFGPVGDFSSRAMVQTAVSVLTESRIPTKPYHIAVGAKITALKNQGLKVKSGVSDQPQIPRSYEIPSNIKYLWTESIPVSNLGRETDNLITESIIYGSALTFQRNTEERAPTIGGQVWQVHYANGRPDVKQKLLPNGRVRVEASWVNVPREKILTQGLHTTYI